MDPSAIQIAAMERLLEEDLTHSIIGAFYEVYNTLGYGFLEHVYVRAMECELRARNHRVGREVGIEVSYKGQPIASQRLDMLVDDRVVVEIKSAVDWPKFAKRQVYSYLRATSLEVGLVLHFGPGAKFVRIIKPNREPGESARPVQTPATVCAAGQATRCMAEQIKSDERDNGGSA